eukprot:TRINITY_DN2761_c3_g1_i1.p1 TRINITY_DN2761_c3_g1~~TRINITY_DN2761_c3_g1_i1.p1  ORF type:complete len:733 (-),score=217.71 TRINITY_DN2761_c3_g1_i1:60-2258(-)
MNNKSSFRNSLTNAFLNSSEMNDEEDEDTMNNSFSFNKSITFKRNDVNKEDILDNLKIDSKSDSEEKKNKIGEHKGLKITINSKKEEDDNNNESKSPLQSPNRFKSISQLVEMAHFSIKFEELGLMSKIGQGFFKEVWKGTFLNAPVAIGIFKGLMKGKQSEKIIEEIRKEVEILQSLRHPNILTFLGVSIDKELNFYMITELAPKGSLIHLLKSHQSASFIQGMKKGFDLELSWETRLEICKQIVSGLTYLHSKQIFHRDLKGDNILIFPAGDNERIMYTVKISDFGLSLLQEKHEIFKLARQKENEMDNEKRGIIKQNSSVGTWFIKAPEVENVPEYDPEMADIFSLGIVFGEIISREEGENLRLLFTIEKNDLTFGVDVSLIEPYLKNFKPPNELIQLVQSCCEEDPLKRITLPEISKKLDEIQEKCNKIAVLNRHFMFLQQNKSKLQQKVGYDGSALWRKATNNRLSESVLISNLTPFLQDFIESYHHLYFSLEEVMVLIKSVTSSSKINFKSFRKVWKSLTPLFQLFSNTHIHWLIEKGYWSPFVDPLIYKNYLEKSDLVSEIILLRLNSKNEFVISYFEDSNIMSIVLKVEENCVILGANGKQDPVAFRDFRKLLKYFSKSGKKLLYTFKLKEIVKEMPNNQTNENNRRNSSNRGSFIIANSINKLSTSEGSESLVIDDPLDKESPKKSPKQSPNTSKKDQVIINFLNKQEVIPFKRLSEIKEENK